MWKNLETKKKISVNLVLTESGKWLSISDFFVITRETKENVIQATKAAYPELEFDFIPMKVDMDEYMPKVFDLRYNTVPTEFT